MRPSQILLATACAALLLTLASGAISRQGETGERPTAALIPTAGAAAPDARTSDRIEGQLQAAPGAITVVPDPLDSGEASFRFRVDEQDVFPVTPTDDPRAQALLPPVIEPGDEFWLGTRLLLPDDFPSVPGWMSLISVYGPPFAGSSPWQIGIDRDELRWQRNAHSSYDVPWRMPVVKGRWIEILVHQRFAADGWVEMWVDGERVNFFPAGNYNPDGHAETDRLAMATVDSSNDGGANSAKIMQYREAGMFDSATVYFGALRVAGSRDAVGG
jgi:hypothetical protein